MSPIEVLNGYIGAHVALAMEQTGILRVLHEGCGPMRIDELARQSSTSVAPTRSILRFARLFGYIHGDEDEVEFTQTGRALYHYRGYFTVAVGGFSPLFRTMSEILQGLEATEKFMRVDQLVARGCEHNWEFQAPVLDTAVQDLPWTKVVDLGCGSGKRLLHLLGNHPGGHGVGVDINTELCAIAQQNAEGAGESHRFSVVRADLADILSHPLSYPQITDANLVMSFFLLHHFARNSEEYERTLRLLRQAFPEATYFIMVDGYRVSDDTSTRPIFSIAFELFHEMLGVRLPTLVEHYQALGRAGFSIVRKVPFGYPNEWLFVASTDV
jgi:SAM-dependent methyltransferase